MKPRPTRLLDPNFKYVPAAETDVRKTFKRKQKELEQEKKQQESHQAMQEAINLYKMSNAVKIDEKETSK